jgi:hypothetical protein
MPSALRATLEADFAQVAKNCQPFCQRNIFIFLPKIEDDNSLWQKAEDALRD